MKTVNFMDAAKAYGEGKTVICKIEGREYKYEPTKGNHLVNDKGHLFNKISSYEILEGKWYIETEKKLPPPVTFIEAINSGKKIKGEFFEAEHYCDVKTILQALCVFTQEMAIKAINDKWYIESEN